MVHMHVSELVCTDILVQLVHVCMWRPEVNVACHSLETVHLAIETGILLWDLGLSIRLDWVVSNSPALTYKLEAITRLRNEKPLHLAFTWVLGNWNSGPHGYPVSTLWVESSPRPELLLLWTHRHKIVCCWWVNIGLHWWHRLAGEGSWYNVKSEASA